MDTLSEQPLPQVKPMPEWLLVVLLGLSGFCGAMATRIVDPMVPEISRDFAVDVTTTALLSSAFALPYAFGQPILGPLGDAFGKARVIKICMTVMTAALLLSAAMPSFSSLFTIRIIAGLAAGGLIPLGLAMLGDRFDMERRQIAISRFLVIVLTGQIAGAALGGFLVPLIGWRGVFLGGGALSTLALAGILLNLKPRANAPRGRFDLGEAFARYGTIFANPRAKVCFTAVFVEGIAIYGLHPHVAHLLEQQGRGSAREAGIVISGMALGGILYAAVVPILLRLMGVYGVMALGGLVAGAGMLIAGFDLGLPSGFVAFCVLGIGFYMLHNSLQTQASELSPTARGSAMALHAFSFFAGQAIGPAAFGHGLISFGTQPPILLAAAVMAVLGAATAQALRAISLR